MSPASEEVPGRTLNGRYRLQKIRLPGIFGTVYLADEFFSRSFVRSVHVKIPRQPGITDVTASHLFEDAIRLAQLLAGQPRWLRQHLPGILDMSLLPPDSAMLVTEAVDGTPLLDWQIDGQKPDAMTQVKRFAELCRIVALLHRHGIVHRELRPQSVVVDAGGKLCLVGLGLTGSADWQQALAGAAPELAAHLAPEVLEGKSGPAADVYALGLLFFEWLTGGGPHLNAPWAARGTSWLELKRSLHFERPSLLRGEIRQAMPGLDDVVLRCLTLDPARRFSDAGTLVDALAQASGGAVAPLESTERVAPAPLNRGDDPGDHLIREARRALARSEIDKAIDRLDVHRPAEWAVVDRLGAHVLRLLGQAYLKRGDSRSARECLEQLRSVQREHALLAPILYAAALTDLSRIYDALALKELAEATRQEAQQLLFQAK